ncbi:MAG: sigma-54-dependent transcriptional regulator [Acidobacteriota bacterium]
MKILLVDDDSQSRRWLSSFLKESGYNVQESENGNDAWEALKKQEFDLLLTDFRMPGFNGLELLKIFKSEYPNSDMDVIVMTAYAEVSNAIDSMRAGAYDYLTKPLRLEELLLVLERLEERRTLRQQNRVFTTQIEQVVEEAVAEKKSELEAIKQAYLDVVGRGKIGIFSSKIKDILENAQKLRENSGLPVLIEGETGTGKEIIARYLHFGDADQRTLNPFIAINCAALTPTLFESELFGYEAGAFTGGKGQGQKGKLDLANGGTLFLDEIAELDLESQAKLLRVLEDKSYYRVGGLKLISTDVWLIAATNRDLRHRVSQGLFREDLYYRLSVARIFIPPLRERPEEIIPLAQMFIEDFAAKIVRPVPPLTQEAARALDRYDWPGNIRELKHIVEYAVLMAKRPMIGLDDLGPLFRREFVKSKDESSGSSDIVSVKENVLAIDDQNFVMPENGLKLDSLVDDLILKALKMHNGNKSKTAAYLGITRSSLYRRLAHLQQS